MKVTQKRGKIMSNITRSLLTFMAALLLISCTAAFPVTVTDCYGNEFIIPEKPQRIVSLSPSNTEILFAVGAGHTVVGVTNYDTYPPEVSDIEKIGDYVIIDNEKVLDLEPDVVFAYYANGNETIEALKDLGLTVITLNPTTIDEIMGNIELIGKVTGHEDEAASEIANMTTVINQVKNSTAEIPENDRPSVLYVVSIEPMYVAGNDTFPSSMITLAGGKNIVETDGWSILTLEDIVDKNPQIIICSGMGGLGDDIQEYMTTNSAIATTDAVKEQRVYAIPDPNIVEIPGPRIAIGLEEIYSYIHPQVQQQISAEMSEDSDGNETTPSETDTNKAPGFEASIALLMVIFSLKVTKFRRK